jgi:hypothetical protein
MADSALAGDVVKYFSRVISSHTGNRQTETLRQGEELFEILALHFATSVPMRGPLTKLVAAQREYQGSHKRDAGLSHDALHGAPRAVIPLLVAYELDRRQIQLEPQVGWGQWLNQFHELTEMVAQPADA